MEKNTLRIWNDLRKFRGKRKYCGKGCCVWTETLFNVSIEERNELRKTQNKNREHESLE